MIRSLRHKVGHSMKRRWKVGVFGLLVFCVAIVVLDRLLPPPLHMAKTGVVITDHQGRWLHGFPVQLDDGDIRWRLQADIEDIDPVFLERLIRIEDKRFYQHPGVDAIAVLRAFRSMLGSGEIVSGASTITMQTARLLEPRPRNLGSKFIEMLRALQLEARLTKTEILELYLTLAPYGGNIEGVRAASLSYFGKEPAALNDAQIALLIALPQSPEVRRPDRKLENAKASRAVILDRLVDFKALSLTRAAEAKEARLPEKRHLFPGTAWHTSLAARQTMPKGGERAISLDKDIQQMTEGLAFKTSEATKSGMREQANVAILVVENRTGAVRASVGSASKSLNGGWIDMTRATRSPGSTLKPFIYGMAFDDGEATSETLIFDAAYSFDGYKPENFNRAFHGDVKVSEALQHSLNVPAVLALDRIGPDRFVSSLAAAGLSARMPQKADRNTSLAVALGGVGLSPRDLAMIYSGLATDGTVRPLVWSAEPPEMRPGFQLLSKASAANLTKIMREAPAPAGRSPAALSKTAPRVAFKTGTSYGHRDAWSAGYTDDFTVIVWVGHANGAPRPGVTGRAGALPLLFDVFDQLHQFNGAQENFDDPTFETGQTLARFDEQREEAAPEIVFPENGVELFLSPREGWDRFSLAVRGGVSPYQWYQDGKPLSPSEDGRTIWAPKEEGFYKITVVDKRGKSTTSKISVRHATEG